MVKWEWYYNDSRLGKGQILILPTLCCSPICLASFLMEVLQSLMFTMLTSLPLSSPAGCPYDGMRYYNISKNQCAPCTGTCDKLIVPCPAICRSGCACPPGTVLHEEECIPTEECPKKGKTTYDQGKTGRCDCHILVCHLTIT